MGEAAKPTETWTEYETTPPVQPEPVVETTNPPTEEK
jgi:hypothetical protein